MQRNYSDCFSPKEAMKILYLCFDPSIDLAGETGGSVHVRAMIRALVLLPLALVPSIAMTML